MWSFDGWSFDGWFPVGMVEWAVIPRDVVGGTISAKALVYCRSVKHVPTKLVVYSRFRCSD